MDNTTIIRVVAGFIAIGFFASLFVGVILYILTLSRALNKCSVTSRTMQPGMVWLLLIPLFGLIWNFFVVLGLAKSLGNEFRARGVQHNESEPGKGTGIAMCICTACSIVPIIGGLPGLAGLVLWIIYWSKIAGFSRLLDQGPSSAVLQADIASA